MSPIYPLLQIPRHKVFVSYHHGNDQIWRKRFEDLFSSQNDIYVSKSVPIGEISNELKTETVRQKIRVEYISDSTVTVVLIGVQTWQRKHVDWEISSSIRDTQLNPRNGLLGILLPTRSDCNTGHYSQFTVPPRLHDNVQCKFAAIYNWSENPKVLSDWIHAAFDRRSKIIPDNSFPHFVNNRSGEGWQV